MLIAKIVFFIVYCSVVLVLAVVGIVRIVKSYKERKKIDNEKLNEVLTEYIRYELWLESKDHTHTDDNEVDE